MTEVFTPEPTETPRVLVPYDQFDPEELAQRLNMLVTTSADALSVRGLAGIISRYSDLSIARQKVRKGQSEQDSIGHFAVLDADGAVQGSASILPGLPLKKQELPLPPILGKGVPVEGMDINVHAWTSNNDPKVLFGAYRALIDKANEWPEYDGPKIWTVEPVKSPKQIHDVISRSGLQEIETARFDDGESRSKIPPKSTLYARDYKHWSANTK